MEIFYKIDEIKDYLSSQQHLNATIGFVPTMGALHKGHVSLIERAKKENTLCVCSIFINPIQFNNKEDLAKYPRTLDADIIKLNAVSCDILFSPLETEIYPVPDSTIYDLGDLDKNMEGAFRPGHFNGVAVIVKKLFDIIKPGKAYFGEKDFQQLAVIKYLVKNYCIPVEIISCPTVREADGLAMSSRNLMLSHEERKAAPLIYQVLLKAKEQAKFAKAGDIKQWAEKEINNSPLMKLEYFEIFNKETIEPCISLDHPENYIACTAVYLGRIRLIDNIKFV